MTYILTNIAIITSILRTSWVTPKTLDNMLKSMGSTYPRRLTERPDRLEFNTLAFVYAAAVMFLAARAFHKNIE